MIGVLRIGSVGWGEEGDNAVGERVVVVVVGVGVGERPAVVLEMVVMKGEFPTGVGVYEHTDVDAALA